MLRGDDVVDLQHRLNALGFDAGREDGIFGPHTSRALQEFQRNAGLAPDGIGGPEAIAALLRLGAMSAGSVAEVREREMLRDPRSLRGMRIYLATGPELHGLGDALVRRLIDAGAEAILDPSGADDAELAAAANDLRADLFLSLRLGPVRDAGASTSRRALPLRRRPAGRVRYRRRAHPLATDRARALGRSYRVLRESAWRPWLRARGRCRTPTRSARSWRARATSRVQWGRDPQRRRVRLRPAGHQPVEPLEITEVGELDHDLALLRPHAHRTRSRGGRRGAPPTRAGRGAEPRAGRGPVDRVGTLLGPRRLAV